MWPLWLSIAASMLAALVILLAGKFLVAAADEIAQRTKVSHALIGATLLGAITSLADITAVSSAAYRGYASIAVSAAVGGIAVQTAFLVAADLALRRTNLEHAAASFDNLISSVVLILILALVVIAALGPAVAVWHIHPVTPLLFLSYGFGMWLVQESHEEPMWRPRVTNGTDKQGDEEANEEHEEHSWIYLIGTLVLAGSLVAFSGWTLSQAGVSLMAHLGLLESAVGGIFIALGTSLPELVTSISAVRRRALALAVGGIIGGNAFDTLMVGLADLIYTGGSIYHAVARRDLAFTALTLLMIAVLLMGLLLRQRKGPANIGLDGVLVLLAYATGLVLLSVE